MRSPSTGAGGKVDPPGSWPPSTPLPDNVHRFRADGVEDLLLEKNMQTLCRVQGVSRVPGRPLDDSGFYRDADGLFTVGVAHGSAASPGAEGDRGPLRRPGRPAPTADRGPIAGDCPLQRLTPGPLAPRNRPPRLHAGGGRRNRAGENQAAHHRRGPVGDGQSGTHLGGRRNGRCLRGSTSNLQSSAQKNGGVDLLVTWEVLGTGPLVNRLRRGGLADDLVRDLRKTAGRESPGVWHVGLECDEPMVVPQEWRDQETILGDMLRQFDSLGYDAEAPLELEQFLPDDCREGEFADLAEVRSGKEREALLRASSKLGLDLLTVEEE